MSLPADGRTVPPRSALLTTAKGRPSVITRVDSQGNTSERRRRAWAMLLALLLGLGLPVIAASSAAAATTWTVTNTNDSGPGSLRQAIINADNGSGGDTIAFAIPGTGPFKISPASDLPVLTVPGTIDGYTQPGSSPATATSPAHIEIQIDGSA